MPIQIKISANRLLFLGGLTAAAAYWLNSQRRNPPLNLKDKVVVITGASTGIGRAFALAFAHQGARLVLAARRADLLDALCQEIGPYAEALAVPTDIGDDHQLQALVNMTLERFGRIDVLVNNAGVAASGPLHTIPAETMKNLMNINLTAPILLTSLCLPTMLSQRSGLVVNVASFLGEIGAPFNNVYGASKHGMQAFTKILRRELDGTGVHVTAVLPGWVDTPMLAADSQVRTQNSQIDSPEYVVHRAIEGLVNGESEIRFGDPMIRLGMWVDHHLPAVMDLYFRITTTPAGIPDGGE